MELSARLDNIEPSRTTHFANLVAKLRQKGERVISLAIGEPHDPVAAGIVSATRKALQAGHTRYSAVPGLDELRAAIALPLPHHQTENVIITNGSKQALFSIFQVICNPGDEVIIPLPCWVSFPEQVKLAGGKPVMVRTENHQLDLAALEQAVSRRTRAILINSPNNPTGAVYPEQDLESIATLARDRDLFIVSDEAYARFVYDNRPFTSLTCFRGLQDRVIATGSFSKSFNMTGFRIGYAIGPAAVITAMANLQSHLAGNVCTFAQHGALAALRGCRAADDRHVREHFQKKRDTAYALTRELFDCVKPRGAFYLFPDISRLLRNGQTATDFAIDLLTGAKVAVMPGETFGVENHLRISFAVSDDDLAEAFVRIRKLL
ncbi:MAG: pyridoxal phosphate-dependent aminotransferase [Desulfobacterales bacterium]|nr:pyridoxal phosphate-dependent aminotransferase [Desulfobacterales bacterium]